MFFWMCYMTRLLIDLLMLMNNGYAWADKSELTRWQAL